MPVPSVITDLSTTAGSNSPAGTDAIGTTADDYIRALAAFIAQLRNGSVNMTAGGTATAPVCAFSGDSNTGIYSPSADVIALAAGGVKAVNVASNGTDVIGSLTATGLIYGHYGSGGQGLGSITVSTSSPSGGSNGDIWIQY